MFVVTDMYGHPTLFSTEGAAKKFIKENENRDLLVCGQKLNEFKLTECVVDHFKDLIARRYWWARFDTINKLILEQGEDSVLTCFQGTRNFQRLSPNIVLLISYVSPGHLNQQLEAA